MMAIEINLGTLRDKTDEELIALADDLAFQLDLVGDEQTRRIIEALQHKGITLNTGDGRQSLLLIIPQKSSHPTEPVPNDALEHASIWPSSA
jgi:hypothetical protein